MDNGSMKNLGPTMELILNFYQNNKDFVYTIAELSKALDRSKHSIGKACRRLYMRGLLLRDINISNVMTYKITLKPIPALKPTNSVSVSA